MLGDCIKSNINYVASDEYGGFVVGFNNSVSGDLNVVSVDTDLLTIRCIKLTGMGIGYYPEITIYKK